MDITQLILDDHAEQRRLFAIIEQIDAGDHDALQGCAGRGFVGCSTRMPGPKSCSFIRSC